VKGLISGVKGRLNLLPCPWLAGIDQGNVLLAVKGGGSKEIADIFETKDHEKIILIFLGLTGRIIFSDR
jgi:hypothetical protein